MRTHHLVFFSYFIASYPIVSYLCFALLLYTCCLCPTRLTFFRVYHGSTRSSREATGRNGTESRPVPSALWSTGSRPVELSTPISCPAPSRHLVVFPVPSRGNLNYPNPVPSRTPVINPDFLALRWCDFRGGTAHRWCLLAMWVGRSTSER